MDRDFRTLLRNYCLDSSILGLKYFYIYPDIISRCFWFMTMLYVTGTGGYMIWLLYERFSGLPTRITIENQYQPNIDLPYPAITICSPNQMTISSANHFYKTLVDGNLTLDLNSTLPQLMGFYIPVKPWNEGALHQLQTLIDQNRHTVHEVLISLPQDCTSFLKMCIFQQKLYPNCRGLMRPIMTIFGLCCVFNSVYYLKDNKRNEKDPNFVSHKVLTTGLRYGLSVVTDYNPSNALDRTIVNAGATRIMFNDVNEFPSVDEMKLVHPNSESFHIIQASYTYCSEDVEALPTSSRNCYFSYEHHLPYFGEFRNSDCDLYCIISAVQDTCHCLMSSVPYLPTHRACNITNMDCILKVRRHVNNYAPQSQCECMRDCNYRRYQTDMSIGNLKGWSNVIANPFASLVEIANKSTSLMHFFFSNPTYVKKKEETVMSLTTLSSNLGGVIGLCLGCSVISLAELLFYVYLYVKNIILNRLIRSSSNTSTSGSNQCTSIELNG